MGSWKKIQEGLLCAFFVVVFVHAHAQSRACCGNSGPFDLALPRSSSIPLPAPAGAGSAPEGPFFPRPRIQQDGRFVAVGGVDGITSLLELSPSQGVAPRAQHSPFGRTPATLRAHSIIHRSFITCVFLRRSLPLPSPPNPILPFLLPSVPRASPCGQPGRAGQGREVPHRDDVRARSHARQEPHPACQVTPPPPSAVEPAGAWGDLLRLFRHDVCSCQLSLALQG